MGDVRDVERDGGWTCKCGQFNASKAWCIRQWCHACLRRFGA